MSGIYLGAGSTNFPLMGSAPQGSLGILRQLAEDMEKKKESLRHKVFISYHHANDQAYRDKLEEICQDIIISKSVQIGDIGENCTDDYIRQKIRTDYLADSTVTIVLIGTETWQRKHVDWEIAASIHATANSTRSGLLAYILPSYAKLHKANEYSPYTIPPRLHKNIESNFAKIYYWTTDPVEIKGHIETAFTTRSTGTIDDSYPTFKKNKSGERWHE